MKYRCKYRQKGQWFWRTLKNVIGDGIEANFRFFTLEDGSMIYIGIDAEVVFFKDREASIAKSISREAGIPIQTVRQ